MCIGLPMKVVETGPHAALCEAHDGSQRMVDLALIGPQPVGTWLLVHIDTARSLLSAEEALQVSNALNAVAAIQRGESIDHLFADLIGREPQLPDFLKGSPADD